MLPYNLLRPFLERQNNVTSFALSPRYWTAHIRSQAEAWKAEALIGFSVFKTSVCVCVCVFAPLQVTVFDLGT